MNRIQARLIVDPIMGYEEIQFFDEKLVDWFQKLPPFLRFDDFSAPDLQDARLVLKWKYQNIRLLLYRPTLVDAVIRRTSLQGMPTSNQVIVSKCRDIAADSIFSIQAEWRPTKICCWNAVWFVFQSCLIPLMALAVESTAHCEYQSWYHQVQIGIAVCGAMSQVSLAGQKTKAVLEQLLLSVMNNQSPISQCPVSTKSQLPTETIMELLADNCDYLGENEIFAQLNYGGISHLEDRFPTQQYQPFG